MGGFQGAFEIGATPAEQLAADRVEDKAAAVRLPSVDVLDDVGG